MNIIERDIEVESFNKTLDEIKSGTAHKATFLEFYGLAGIGKTQLLDHLHSQAQILKIPTVQINLQMLGQNSEAAKLELTQQVVDVLKDLGNSSLLQAYRTAMQNIQHSSGDISTVSQTFTAYLSDCLTRQPGSILLTFDQTDRFPKDILKWLNQDVFKHLVDRHNLIVIFAGRAQLPADQSDPLICGLLKSREIPALSSDGTHKHITSSNVNKKYRHSSPKVQFLTQGHPRSNVHIIDYLKQKEPKSIQSALRDMAQCLQDEIIDEYIFNQIDPNLQIAIRLVAYPRHFEVSLLTELLKKHAPRPSHDPADPVLSNWKLIDDLIKTLLVAYDKGAKAYKLNALLANLIQTSDLLIAPERFKVIHKTMAEYLRKLVAVSKGSDIASFVEMFYHQAQVHRGQIQKGEEDEAGAVTALKKLLKTELKFFYNQSTPQNYEHVKNLRIFFHSHREFASSLDDISGAFELILADNLAARSHPPCARLTITHEVNLHVNLQSPDQATSLGGRTFGLSPQARLQVQDVLDDLETGTSKNCQRMFSLCMPPDIQDALHEMAQASPLQLATNFADQPWELMHDGDEFLSLKFQIGRTLDIGREPHKHSLESEELPRFLLISNPTGDLPGADNEVAAIHDKLKGKAHITVLAGSDATRKALFDNLIQTKPGYDVIHYAGHASFNTQHPDMSGLILNDGTMFGYEIEQTLKCRPLVFLNACEAGLERTSASPGGFMSFYTAGLLTSFLRGGARACIGPLWGVSDGAAKNFAVTFYEHTLGGTPLGEALRQTRLYSRDLEPKLKVWASYVLYGDPTDCLVQ